MLRRRARSQRDAIASASATLTPREQEVLRCVVAGCSNRETAAELGIAESTVKVHRGHVMEKMGAHSVAELVRLADAAGLSGPLDLRD